MTYDLKSIKDKIEETKNWLSREYSGIRTGRATPVLLDSIMVDVYGSKTPIKHVATITTEDAKTLRVVPWDKSHIGPLESAIGQANLGVSTAPDDSGVRVIFPDLTQERRGSLIKLTNEKLEDAKISLRKEREHLWSDIQDKERKGEISEDDKFRLKEELQKILDDAIDGLEKMKEHKEGEIKQ